MANMFDYIKKYGAMSFRKKPFTEIDNLVFCAIAYLDFGCTDLVRQNMTIGEAAQQYFAKNTFLKVSKIGIPQRDAFKVLKFASEQPRYRDIMMMSYEYRYSSEYQFGAVCYRISNNLIYLCFEGTDQLISGWKEDFEFSHTFPVRAEELAIDYANRNIRAMGPEVIMGGHSKGGHLALVASMFMKRMKQRKIVRIISNDGPGLRWAEFTSYRYAAVRSRYEHIVPANSTFGVLLRNDKYKIIRSTGKAIMAHAMASWEVVDDKLRPAKDFVPTTVKLRDGVLAWLDDHDDVDRKKMVDAIFSVFEKNGIDETSDMASIKNIAKVIRSVKNLDDESRELGLSLLSSAFGLSQK